MASTYTANNGIEKPGSGEQSGTWGTTTNTNFDIIDRALNGVGAITLSGTTHTLSTSDGALSDGHYKVLVLGGSPSGANTITISPNDQDKLYFVYNNTSQNAIFSQGSGANATILAGDFGVVYADGAGAGAAVTLMAFPVATADIADGAVTSAKILDGTIATADMADDAVTSAKIADDAVGADQLASDAVVNASVATSAALAFSKMENLTASRALVSDSNGDVSVSAVTSTEVGYLDGVTSNLQTQINNIAGYPQVVTVKTSGSSYTIPSDAQAVLIRASGGGGGGATWANPGGNVAYSGGDGGSTTVTNSTLSISITAVGGQGGKSVGQDGYRNQTGSSGGDVLTGYGAPGGRAATNQYDVAPTSGQNGDLVVKYVTGSNVGGETLSFSLGAGGTSTDISGYVTGDEGLGGFVEITVW